MQRPAQRPALWVFVATYVFWAIVAAVMFAIGWWYVTIILGVILVAGAVGLMAVKPLPQRESLPCPNCGYRIEIEEAA